VPMMSTPRSAPTRPGTGTRRWLQVAAVGVSMAVVIGLATLTRPGRSAAAQIHAVVEYYAGVVSLVALSMTMMGGLAATERAVFGINQRIRLQLVHRALAFTSVAFLFVHVVMKLIEAHAHVLDVMIPFRASHRAIPVGLGTIAAYLMVTVLWTGVVRARFAGSARPWLWRTLHSLAYLAWPIALVHGLESGRPAKPWVVVSYIVCLLVVAITLVVRLVGWLSRPVGVVRARTAAVVETTDRYVTDPTAFAVATLTGPLPLADRANAAPQPGHADRPTAPAAPDLTTPRPAPTPNHPGVEHPFRARPRAHEPVPHSPFSGPRTDRSRDRRRHSEHAVANLPPSRPNLPEDASDEQFWAFLRGEQAR
jgi:hypothetical protein